MAVLVKFDIGGIEPELDNLVDSLRLEGRQLMDLSLEEYLKPTQFLDCETRSIKEKAEELAERQTGAAEKAKSLFYFVRDEIIYNPHLPRYLPEHYRASNILERGGGYCVQKAVLLVALTRAAGIPARLRFANIRNHLQFGKLSEIMGTNLFIYHGLAEIYIEGEWLKATPTFDLKMCKEQRIVPVDFDGSRDAIFHSHNQDGKLHIEYVCDHGHYADVPLAEIARARVEGYGRETAKRLEMSNHWDESSNA